MKKVAEKVDAGGKLQVMEDYDKHLFLARPHGIINPSLLAEDFKRAVEFSNRIDDHWTYCTNTEDVRLVNPLNILFLKEIKKIKKLKQIVIYAPGVVNRALIRAASFLIKPDRVIKDKQEFLKFLETVR
jgi:hypothetical protein